MGSHQARVAVYTSGMDLSVLDSMGGTRVVVGVIVALVTLLVVRRLMKAGRVEGPMIQQLKCGNCGWQGSVSKHKPKCPKCGNSLG